VKTPFKKKKHKHGIITNHNKSIYNHPIIIYNHCIAGKGLELQLPADTPCAVLSASGIAKDPSMRGSHTLPEFRAWREFHAGDDKNNRPHTNPEPNESHSGLEKKVFEN
jgi:hypothetical protein